VKSHSQRLTILSDLLLSNLLFESLTTQGNTMHISPQTVYDNLTLLEQVDTTRSAFYRELAQAILADSDVCLAWREAIADRLNQANNRLAVMTVGGNDSY
jgi:hypothetical protein